MATVIKLSGNLGERHRRLNDLVCNAYEQNTSSIQDLRQPADRLFAIDLASKQKNVDYILKTLKDDDMLYVSRALKSFWLLEPELSHIINPSYLECQLFPRMTLQAVSKMRNWIRLHLRDPERSKEFYEFYKNRKFEIAAKFLWHCFSEYLLSEVTCILEKITPKLLKVVSEKVPKITKIYFDSLKENQTLLRYYLKNDLKFYANLKYLLKPDANVFFYVLENFFATTKYPTFNSTITRYIMRNHKIIFMRKSELYTSRILNIDTLAKCLDSGEIKELVLKLAKAEYLSSWFTYKTVEPLIKCLSVEERKSFKKLVFVDKIYGETVKEWPYPISFPPELRTPQTKLFEDTTIFKIRKCPSRSMAQECCFRNKSKLRKRKYSKWQPEKTFLDELFERYRFCNYKQTLLELQKRLRSESSSQNRQYMFLVLISKTGGEAEDLASLLELLSHYKNEPVQIRATIVRSLVRRAFVWRLAPELWARLLKWGHGLGLDGSTPEAACHEGLHAVVLRDLLTGVTPTDAVSEAYLSNFSNLTEYNLTAVERVCLSTRLPKALLALAQSEPDKASVRLHLLLDTLSAYRIRFNHFPGAVEAIKTIAENDFESAKDLLRKLYKAGVSRQNLMRENFKLIHTDEFYVNVLRHDASVLNNTTQFEELIDNKELKHEKFLRKLAVYYTEKDGLKDRYLAVLQGRANTKPDKILARSLSLLSGSSFPSLLKLFDAAPTKTPQRQLAAALRANAHVVRPAFDFDSFEWQALGAKAVVNRVVTCRQDDCEVYLHKTLSWNRTLRLAVILSKRVNKEYEAFNVFASKRPGAALSTSLRYFQCKGNNLDRRIWDTVKSHIPKTGPLQLRYLATKYMESVPIVIKAEYCILIYKAAKNSLPHMDLTILLQMSCVLADVDELFFYDAIDDFIKDYLNGEKLKVNYKETRYISLFLNMIGKFLLLCTSKEMLEEKLQKVGIPLFQKIQFMKPINVTYNDNEQINEKLFDSFLLGLRYNKVYFDDKYVSCLPVFERLTEWMHGWLPIEIWFDKYVSVHLTTIYFKTVRHCLEQNPALFSDEAKKIEAGPKMLGTIFGIFLSSEIEELAEKKFFSITELYGRELVNYFNGHFYNHRDDSIDRFTGAVLMALLTRKSVSSFVLAKHIFVAFRDKLGSEKCTKDIEKTFKESEIKEFLFDLDD